MNLTISTWNINSVRLRLDQVGRFLKERRPDILCLQETKCPNDKFPLKDLQAFGYPFVVHMGQKGYNGVAILSRYPFSETSIMEMCGRQDARHITVTLSREAKGASGITIHNFYVPAGGDIPDPDLNEKFRHKLDFMAEMRSWGDKAKPTAGPAILVGDLNVAPLEHDVWSHKQLLDVVSHTPIETEALEELRQEAGWVDAMRALRPEPEKIYSWWSYRSPDWAAADKGRRLDHIWLAGGLDKALRSIDVTRETRGWERPSDHVPVTAVLEF
ncbi:exodeoxyribonuclease III [Microvirga roseola]|uniref:exodeoxyribonuclease III n=1 Tax=Microvirga roseola TaxID=2883126 RepID=UPI001E4309B9|nr:exodeoxyribonuclease III [Microvirga roseola]